MNRWEQEAESLISECMPLAHDWEADSRSIAIKIALFCIDQQIHLLEQMDKEGGYYYSAALDTKKALQACQ